MSTTTITAPVAVISYAPEEELHLVEFLAERLRTRFAGDGPEHARIDKRYPSRVLQLGILPPLPEPDATEPITPEELAKKLNRAPSTIGLDFLMTRKDGRCAIELSADFAVYVQRYPSRDEQEEFYRGEDYRSGEEDERDAEADDSNMRLRPVFERFDVPVRDRDVELDGDRGEATLELAPELTAALGHALLDDATVYPFAARRSQTLPVSALDGDQAGFEAAIREAEGDARSRPLEPHDVKLHVSWRAEGEDLLRVQVTLRNDTLVKLRSKRKRKPEADQGDKTKKQEPRELPRDMELFNCRVRVLPAAGSFAKTVYTRKPKDFRYGEFGSVWATGRNCVARRAEPQEDPAEPLISDTWPRWVQPRLAHRQDAGTEVTFAELANEASCVAALTRILGAMKVFEGRWKQAIDAMPTGNELQREQKQDCSDGLTDFQGEMAAFDRGIACITTDPLLAKAFRAANRCFDAVGAKRDPQVSSWRLFQVVYHVIHLAALRAREARRRRPDAPSWTPWTCSGSRPAAARPRRISGSSSSRCSTTAARQAARRHRHAALPAADALRPAAPAPAHSCCRRRSDHRRRLLEHR